MKNLPKITSDVVINYLGDRIITFSIFKKYYNSFPNLTFYDMDRDADAFLETKDKDFIKRVERNGQIKELYKDVLSLKHN